ncbi:hypothetical protein L6164_001020 [Bauhinia variegata]|uniref:Uncharacterized protein n=1 Tax=Bauhinia variegata TaxID=167791 RepID=A0ACB9Q8T7_BAUVA|nr:hypothetical protein L6164_001020 [Bauhinia variegata]
MVTVKCSYTVVPSEPTPKGPFWLSDVDQMAAWTHFVNSWAKLARGETLKVEELPFLDRTIMRSSDPPAAPRFDHKAYEFMSMPLILGSSDSIGERKKETCVAFLPLTRDQVLKIKNKANEETAVSSLVRATRPYSRYECQKEWYQM